MSQEDWDRHNPAAQKQLISNRTAQAVNPTTIRSTKAQELLARLAEAKEHTYALQQLWVALEICSCAPDQKQFTVWFAQRHTFETLEAAFADLSVWLSIMRTKEPDNLATKTHDDKIRMASGVLFKNLRKAQNG